MGWRHSRLSHSVRIVELAILINLAGDVDAVEAHQSGIINSTR
jgi:hypothetical protein